MDPRIHGDAVLHRALYPLTLVSANIYTGWILVMPLLRVVQNEITGATPDSVHTTTISETFGTFNVLATVIIIGPLSVIFVFRVHRTLSLPTLSERSRRLLFLLLIVVQYTMFVVLRYDALKGAVHYAFTGATFALLYFYHVASTSLASHGAKLFKAKLVGGGTSALCIFCFLSFILLWRVPETPSAAWTATCVCEVVGALALASLDVIDLYVFRTRPSSWHREHCWDLAPTLVYWRVMRRCLYYGMAVSVVLFAAWVVWVPLLGLLWPTLVQSTVTTISYTFSTYNVVSTIYLVGPLCMFFCFHFYRVAFSVLLSKGHRRALLLALVVLQYSLFIVLRADAIEGGWHYLFTALVFVCIYWYHLAVADANVQRAKIPILCASFLCIVAFGAGVVGDAQGTWWRVACMCEVSAVALIAVLESIDVLDFVVGPGACGKQDDRQELLWELEGLLPQPVAGVKSREAKQAAAWHRKHAEEKSSAGEKNYAEEKSDAEEKKHAEENNYAQEKSGGEPAAEKTHNAPSLKTRRGKDRSGTGNAIWAFAPGSDVRNVLQRSRDNSELLWHAPVLPAEPVLVVPDVGGIGNVDPFLTAGNEVVYAPVDLWAGERAGSMSVLCDDDNRAEKWVQSFGFDRRAWLAPQGPEPFGEAVLGVGHETPAQGVHAENFASGQVFGVAEAQVERRKQQRSGLLGVDREVGVQHKNTTETPYPKNVAWGQVFGVADKFAQQSGQNGTGVLGVAHEQSAQGHTTETPYPKNVAWGQVFGVADKQTQQQRPSEWQQVFSIPEPHATQARQTPDNLHHTYMIHGMQHGMQKLEGLWNNP